MRSPRGNRTPTGFPAETCGPIPVHPGSPTALIFPETFHWTQTGWSGINREDLVLYELHVGTFTREGTFDAIIPRLKELRDLGITAIELMPCGQFPGGRNWGYDGVHLFAVQNTYGGPRGLQRLVDAAHRAGLGVILDVVYNHFGPEGNYISEFGPYYSDRYRTPWGPAFNFDGRGSDAVRDFVLENVQWWIREFHLDGLRLDAVHAMFDNSPRHILREIQEVASAVAPDRQVHIIVESLMNDVRMLLPPERGGYGLSAEWNEDFHHAVAAFVTGERHYKYSDFGDIQQIAQALENTFVLSGGYSRYRGRRWGAPAAGLPGDRFVIGIQNHDHVGNRGYGERLTSLVGPAVHRLTASLMLLAPHLPLLFMGEEYGERNPFLYFCSFEDPALIEGVRSGRKRDYALEGDVPDPQSVETFEQSRLSWEWPQGSDSAGLRQLYHDLLEARRQWPALRNWTDRVARLAPDPATGPVIELLRGPVTNSLQSMESAGDPRSHQRLVCRFNMSSLPQPLEAEPAQLLFRSEAPQYCATGTSPLDNVEHDHLMPYEAIVVPFEAASEQVRNRLVPAG